MYSLAHDIRDAARVLAKTPAFTLTAVFILALGLGASTAVFSIANALLFRPLNNGTPGGLVQLYSCDRSEPGRYRPFSYPNYRDIRESREVFGSLFAEEFVFAGVTSGSSTRRVFAAMVSSDFFPTLGVHAARGRWFTPAEEQPGSPATVVVSHAYWVSTGLDPDLVGKSVRINARTFTIVGIMPPGFSGTMVVASPMFWLPLGVADSVVSLGATSRASILDRANHRFRLVGRLKPGLTLASAGPRLEALGHRLEQAYPAENRNQDLVAGPLARIGASTAPRSERLFATAMTFVLAMATVVLLVACLNLANMMLARGGLRRREFAIRLALGGSRLRLVRGLLVEAFLLSLAGGLAGLWLAYAAGKLMASTLVSLVPAAVVFDATPDVRVLGATLAFCVVSAIVFGLGPALRLSRGNLVPALKEQAGDIFAGASRRRRLLARQALVVGQVALSLALLTAGGLFLRGATNAATGDPGFSVERVLLVTMDPTLADYDEARGRRAYDHVLARVRSLPGIVSASVASTMPYGEVSQSRSVQPAGAAGRQGSIDATYVVVGADYFRTLGLPIARGREFTAAEEASASPASPAIVDMALAQRLWPGRDAIGRRLQMEVPAAGGRAKVDLEVVGIAANVRSSLFAPAGEPHLYVPFGGNYEASMTLHARTVSPDPRVETAMLETLRAEIRGAEPDLPVVSAKTFRQHRDSSFEIWYMRTAASLFTAFGAAALLMAAVGLYGLRAFLVARRRHEIGIRMALGASAGDVMRMVMVEGLRLVVAGSAAGLLLASGVSRLLAGWIYGVRAFEPIVFVGAPLVLAVSMLLACYLPARRATAIEPVTALRYE